jgi:hypothetical protein
MRPMDRRNRCSENNKLVALLDYNADEAHRQSQILLGSDDIVLAVGSKEFLNTAVVVLVLVLVILPSPFPFSLPLHLLPSLSFCHILGLPLFLVDNANTSIYHRPNARVLSYAKDTSRTPKAWLARGECCRGFW